MLEYIFRGNVSYSLFFWPLIYCVPFEYELLEKFGFKFFHLGRKQFISDLTVKSKNIARDLTYYILFKEFKVPLRPLFVFYKANKLLLWNKTTSLQII